MVVVIQNLDAKFWLKILINLFLSVMPPIRATPVLALREVAESWRANYPGVAPEGISYPTRLASAQARAAYFVARSGGEELPAGFGGCNQCGEVTASWCEGCYRRCESSRQAFSSICQWCDSDRKVCDLCQAEDIDYAKGHQAYLRQRQSSSENSIEITGAFESNGEYMEIHGQFRRTTSEQGPTSE